MSGGKDRLKQRIRSYLRKKQLFKSEEYKALGRPFAAKARKNFTVANLLFSISEQEEMKKRLMLVSDFEMYEWVIIVAYYAMYASALAALAKAGYKSKSHVATITVLEYEHVKECQGEIKSLNKKDLRNLAKAYTISEQLITKLLQTKIRRESAQYDATPSITKEMAKSSFNDADEFITKIEEMFS